MIKITIPGHNDIYLSHLVLDFNGTLAIDGKLIDGVCERLNFLSQNIQVVVVTADTFGTAAQCLAEINCHVKILSSENQDLAKQKFVKELGSNHVVAIGNGNNDRLMLAEAALGIAVIQAEGASSDTMRKADIVCLHINDALDLIANPLRIAATLRI